MHKHQFETAIYVGDKLLAITSHSLPYPSGNLHFADMLQMILTTLSFWLKSIFPLGTMPVRWASSRSTISLIIAPHVDTLQHIVK